MGVSKQPSASLNTAAGFGLLSKQVSRVVPGGTMALCRHLQTSGSDWKKYRGSLEHPDGNIPLPEVQRENSTLMALICLWAVVGRKKSKLVVFVERDNRFGYFPPLAAFFGERSSRVHRAHMPLRMDGALTGGEINMVGTSPYLCKVPLP